MGEEIANGGEELEPRIPADYQLACPYLGLDRDRSTHARQPSPLHRCYRKPNQTLVPVELYQTRFCLSSAHASCRLLGDPDLRIDSRRKAQGPIRAVGAGTASRLTGAVRTMGLAGLLLLFAGSAGLAVAQFLSSAGTSANAPSAAPPAMAEPSPASAGTVAVTATAFSSTPLAPTATAPPVLTPTSSPTPARPGRYVVKPGDSYSMIARIHGITIDELLAANHRTTADQLFPGDVLTIP